jgi:hypothetical protein
MKANAKHLTTVLLAAPKAYTSGSEEPGLSLMAFHPNQMGLVALQCLEDFLYHWGPWKIFTTGLIAAWARHFR